MDRPTIYIGYDSRETIAYDVCKFSIERRASKPVNIMPIIQSELIKNGLYTRNKDPLATTEFTYTRFFTPYLNNYNGIAIFVDCDFLFLADIWELIDQYDSRMAVQCVQHDYRPTETTKMDGMQQTSYPRKNWSSLVMWNCAHPKNQIITPDIVNTQTGAFLHRFQWLNDEEVGSLPYYWNFLEGWYRPVNMVKAVHFTRGGCWMKDWQHVDYADAWRQEYAAMTGKEFNYEDSVDSGSSNHQISQTTV